MANPPRSQQAREMMQSPGMQQGLNELQKQMAALAGQVQALREENAALRTENKLLRQKKCLQANLQFLLNPVLWQAHLHF